MGRLTRSQWLPRMALKQPCLPLNCQWLVEMLNLPEVIVWMSL